MMAKVFDPKLCVLEGLVVRLEPIEDRHAADLFEGGGDEAIWRDLPRRTLSSVADTRDWIGEAQASMAAGDEVVFAITLRSTGQAIGSTRYMAIRRPDRGLEIGWTWIAKAHQRSAVNSECKLLLLRHAFDDLGAVRVEFKTDVRNIRSQRAIERIGGQREGIFRRHKIRPDGSFRDTVYYAILDQDWPVVKSRLETFLARE